MDETPEEKTDEPVSRLLFIGIDAKTVIDMFDRFEEKNQEEGGAE